jgi:hypothetical protein
LCDPAGILLAGRSKGAQSHFFSSLRQGLLPLPRGADKIKKGAALAPSAIWNVLVIDLYAVRSSA